MLKVLFVCHGNICRSPMAEFMFKDMVKRLHQEQSFEIASAATSREEIGNPVHYGTRNKLAQYGISVAGKYARQITKQDYAYYDYILVMDQNNLRNIVRVTGPDTAKKIYLLLDFTERKGQSIADPWYTDDFDATYDDISYGLEGFYSFLKENNYI